MGPPAAGGAAGVGDQAAPAARLQLPPKCLRQHGLIHARRGADGASCGLLNRIRVRNKGLNLSDDAALFAEGGAGNRNDPLSSLCRSNRVVPFASGIRTCVLRAWSSRLGG
jgi:hypothetical protein